MIGLQAASAVVCALLLAIPAAADEATLRQIMSGLAAAPSRETAFTSRKDLPSLAQPVRSTGRLIFHKPDRLEQITATPRFERLVIDADAVEITVPGAATQRIELDNSPALRLLADTLRGSLAGDLATLRRHFTVEETGPLAGWRITLLPSGNVAAQSIRRVVVDGTGAVIRQIDIAGADGSEQRIIMTS